MIAWNDERAFAEARDHRLAAGLDALGDGDLALARQQLHRAHLAQIHAHRIVGALGGNGLGGLGERLRGGLDQLAARLLVVVLVVLGFFRLFRLDDVDAHFVEHREHVLDFFRGHFLGRHHVVQLVVGDVAAFLRKPDHLLDGGVREIEERPGFGGVALGDFFLLRLRHRRLIFRRGRGAGAGADCRSGAADRFDAELGALLVGDFRRGAMALGRLRGVRPLRGGRLLRRGGNGLAGNFRRNFLAGRFGARLRRLRGFRRRCGGLAGRGLQSFFRGRCGFHRGCGRLGGLLRRGRRGRLGRFFGRFFGGLFGAAAQNGAEQLDAEEAFLGGSGGRRRLRGGGLLAGILAADKFFRLAGLGDGGFLGGTCLDCGFLRTHRNPALSNGARRVPWGRKTPPTLCGVNRFPALT